MGTPVVAAQPNFILVVIDTLRADRVSALAPASPVKTPALDSLAVEGVLFERAFTTNPLTFPAHASLFTGMWPLAHGVRDFTGYVLTEDKTTLAETLSRAGYRCVAFVSAAVLDHRTGMAQGFGEYNDGFDHFLGPDARVAERSGRQTLDLAKQWLERRREAQPFFLWVHLFEPHDPYLPPEPFRSRFPHDPYSGEVAYVDSLLADFWAFLKEKGLYDSALIVALSDHGEGLGDHGESRHGYFIYQSTVHVPWIMKLPGGEFAGRRVRSNVSVVDLFPTILHILNVERQSWPLTLQGESRYRLLRSPQATSGPVYFESQTPRNQYGWSDLRGLQWGRYKLIEAPLTELYDLDADPVESNNLFHQDRALGLELGERLKQFEARFGGSPAPLARADPELQERLRSLGYAGIAAPKVARSRQGLSDPKKKIGVHEQVQRGVEAARERRWEEAIRELGAAARVEPGAPGIASSLALAYRDAGQLEEAAEWFSRVLELQPEDLFVRTEFVKCLLSLGRSSEAETQLRRILSLDSRHFLALFNLGTLLARRSRFSQAIEYFEKALAVKEDGGVLRSLALAYTYTGNLERAEKLLLRALEIQPDDGATHRQLAELYRRLGDRRKAEEHDHKSRRP